MESWPKEFVKRVGFALMTSIADHGKSAGDDVFAEFLSMVTRESVDDRNFVKKRVNWSLRQFGDRNIHINDGAILTAVKIGASKSGSARWISADALRELRREKVQSRLRAKAQLTGKQ